MKRYFVQIAFADNGGILLAGPVTHKDSDLGNKLYISKSLDPKEIGEMFLAFQADIKLDSKIDLDNIEF